MTKESESGTFVTKESKSGKFVTKESGKPKKDACGAVLDVRRLHPAEIPGGA